jgi:hypothetical protein
MATFNIFPKGRPCYDENQIIRHSAGKAIGKGEIMSKRFLLGLVFSLVLAGLGNKPIDAQNFEPDYNIMLQQGLDAQKYGDYPRAYHIFLTTANAGLAEAQYRVAYCYLTGEGTKMDPYQAFKWFQAGANQGDPKNEFYLGSCYENGWGVIKDMAQAQKWYQAASQQGFPGAANSLKRLEATPTPLPSPGVPPAWAVPPTPSA